MLFSELIYEHIIVTPHRVFRWENGVVIVWFHEPWLIFALRKKRWQLPPAWPAHVLLNFSRSSGINAQLADGVGEPFLKSTDRVSRSSRWGVWTGARAAWGLMGHRAHRWGDTAITACHRVRFCCKETEREKNLIKVQQLIRSYRQISGQKCEGGIKHVGKIGCSLSQC